jgi:hypothetical protein
MTKIIFVLEFYAQFYICKPKFGKKYSQRANFGPKVSEEGQPFHGTFKSLSGKKRAKIKS